MRIVRQRDGKAPAMWNVWWATSLALALLSLVPHRARAQASTSSLDVYGMTTPGTGLGVVSHSERSTYLDFELLLWTGLRPDGGLSATLDDTDTSARADAVVLAVRGRLPDGWGELRAGRFILSTGAVRPVHIDGAHALLRAPFGTTLEVFGGIPVRPELGARRYAWLVGSRLAHRFGSIATIGASIYQRRDQGAISDREAGVDLAITPTPWLDIAALASLDLALVGLADVNASIAMRFAPLRVEAFVRRRSPARILPSTSLFTVLGDVPATNVGAHVSWDVAPRLDLAATTSLYASTADVGWGGDIDAILRLDDDGVGRISGQIRRQDYLDGSFVGARVASRVALTAYLLLACELELVRPDRARGRGALWPFGRVSATWVVHRGWSLATAFEAGASPIAQSETRVMARLSYESAPW